MILGIGTDLVEISRIQQTLKKFRNRFEKRCFTKNEILLSKKIINKPSYYAKKFATKEAFSKAIGTGISKGVYFKNIEVCNNRNGQPFIKLSGKVKKKFDNLKSNKKDIYLNVSITDEKKLAHAIVIISKS